MGRRICLHIKRVKNNEEGHCSDKMTNLTLFFCCYSRDEGEGVALLSRFGLDD